MSWRAIRHATVEDTNPRQIKCLKDSAMNESANHQSRFFATYHNDLVIFKLQSMHVNIPIIVG